MDTHNPLKDRNKDIVLEEEDDFEEGVPHRCCCCNRTLEMIDILKKNSVLYWCSTKTGSNHSSIEVSSVSRN